MPERWIRAVIRARFPTLAVWAAIAAVGLVAALRLGPLLANVFTVPGTDSDRARLVLQRDFRERPDGVFTVVFHARKDEVASVRTRLRAAAALVPTGHATQVHAAHGILYGDIDTTLDLQDAKSYTVKVRRALAGSPKAYVTGSPAIQHDLEPILAGDLRRGEAIALPIALAVLVAVLGFSLAVLIPFVFAACTITATLAVVWVLAHELTMVSYVSNLVELVGLGLAIDYSLLVVARFREELAHDDDVDAAVVRTMQTAGRAVLFSGATVAVGLALLLFVPVPFIRSLGIGGFLVPLASLAAAATLQPALLSVLGRRVTRRTFRPQGQFWAKLAASIMRRPWRFLLGGVVLLGAAAVPAFWLQVTPGSVSALPGSPESVVGIKLLREQAGAGALTPIDILAPRTATRAIARVMNRTFHDPEAYITASGTKPPYVAGDWRRIYVVGRHEYGAEETQALVRRIRAYTPKGWLVGGAPGQGVDYLDRSYGPFPWLVAAALVLTYVLLLRAFRSLLLPLKAVLLNVLSVGATYGLLVIVFRWGVGAHVLGLARVSQIEGWIPIFLFAMLFGLSMDYEVFLVTRMREAWDETHDNGVAVARGLERTGRIVTAAALIMVAAFSGFMAGRVAGLQEFGAGLAFAILIDATIVRAVLVPALMAILGRWNWYLPRGGGRSPLPSSTRST